LEPAARPPEITAVWPIIRGALAGAGPRVRRLVRLIALFALVMIALQVWDSRNAEGPGGVAEFLSVALGVAGIALLGLATALQLSMEGVAHATPSEDDPGRQRVLLALPAVGFGAGIALAGATILMIVRGVLGAEIPLFAMGTLVYGGLTIVAARTVMRSVRTLFEFAGRQARAAAEHRAAATAARLDALQARMNPHVLFNALNTVASLVRSNPPAAERVVETLAGVLRRTLDRSSDMEGTVADEIDYVRACLALEAERWGPHLKVTWNVDERLLSRPMPAFVIQPLVENALKHGLGTRLDGGHVEISLGGDEDGLTVRVADDGTGFARNWVEGMGLGTLRRRLAAMYGTEAKLTIDSRPGASSVVVRVPGQRFPTRSSEGS
jgi:hypothetical protein